MNASIFEKWLSFKPKFDPPNEEPCLRDMVFNYYADVFEDDKADRLTKAYIEQIWERY